MAKLEEEVRLQTARYQESNDQYEQSKLTISRMKELADEQEQTIHECQQRLLGREDELQGQSNRCRSLEDSLLVSERQCSELREEVSH